MWIAKAQLEGSNQLESWCDVQHFTIFSIFIPIHFKSSLKLIGLMFYNHIELNCRMDSLWFLDQQHHLVT